ATAFGALDWQSSPLHEHRRNERCARADDQGISGLRDVRLADGPERVARAFPAGRAKNDRVVLGELVRDHLGRIAGSRDEPLDALVMRALAEALVDRHRPATPVAFGYAGQRVGAGARSCELARELSCESCVP